MKWFRGKSIFLDWWNPSVGCLTEDKEFRMVWVRILGIPLHLWGKSLFKSLGEACGCFVAVDEDTSEHRFLQWARILVKVRGWNFSSSLQVVVGSTSYAIHLWWETLPWKSEVQPLQRCKGRGGGDEVVDGSHTPQRVAKVLSVKGTSLVSLDDLLFSAKGEKGTIPDVMEAVVGAETSLPPASDGLELSGGGSSELGQPAFLLGPEKGANIKRPPFFKAQLDLGRDCPLRRGEKFCLWILFSSSPLCFSSRSVP